MTPDIRAIVSAFTKNVSQISGLMNFDQQVMDHAIGIVKSVEQDVGDEMRFTARMRFENQLTLLENVRTHDSLRPGYNHIRNQCAVLLVSYFGAAMKDLFVLGLRQVIAQGATKALAKEELKLTVAELSAFAQEDLPDLFVAKCEISFQDMKSISRAFDAHLGVPIARDPDSDNIIVGQACRHALVHYGGVCDQKTVVQMKAASSHTVGVQLRMGEPIQLSDAQIGIIGQSMVGYMNRVGGLLSERLVRSAV
jgi:hypothetical protein